MSRAAVVPFLLLAVLSVALAACSKSATYPGAVYAEGAVAAYQTAEFDGAMGGESSGEGVESSESVSWFFKTTDPLDKVVAFYEAKLPQATKEVADDEVTFRFVPAGAEPGEEVAVILGEGRIQVHESTRAGKHKDTSCYDKAMEESGLGWAK